jgi:hypothetical protein
MLLKIIMREENMVFEIFMLLKHSLYIESFQVALILPTHACYYVLF